MGEKAEEGLLTEAGGVVAAGEEDMGDGVWVNGVEGKDWEGGEWEGKPEKLGGELEGTACVVKEDGGDFCMVGVYVYMKRIERGRGRERWREGDRRDSKNTAVVGNIKN